MNITEINRFLNDAKTLDEEAVGTLVDVPTVTSILTQIEWLHPDEDALAAKVVRLFRDFSVTHPEWLSGYSLSSFILPQKIIDGIVLGIARKKAKEKMEGYYFSQEGESWKYYRAILSQTDTPAARRKITFLFLPKIHQKLSANIGALGF